MSEDQEDLVSFLMKTEIASKFFGVNIDPDALAAFLESQKPKPEPNNTPRGILTLAPINHRLGLWDNPLYD